MAPLKNRNYKAPLYEYMTREGFPFQRDVKIGFSPSLEERAVYPNRTKELHV